MEDTSSSKTKEPDRRLPHLAPRRSGDRMYTIEAAADRLSLDSKALRARCRRAAQIVGDDTVANLGGGIVAFKFGRSWRVRFP